MKRFTYKSSPSYPLRFPSSSSSSSSSSFSSRSSLIMAKDGDLLYPFGNKWQSCALPKRETSTTLRRNSGLLSIIFLTKSLFALVATAESIGDSTPPNFKNARDVPFPLAPSSSVAIHSSSPSSLSSQLQSSAGFVSQSNHQNDVVFIPSNFNHEISKQLQTAGNKHKSILSLANLRSQSFPMKHNGRKSTGGRSSLSSSVKPDTATIDSGLGKESAKGDRGFSFSLTPRRTFTSMKSKPFHSQPLKAHDASDPNASFVLQKAQVKVQWHPHHTQLQMPQGGMGHVQRSVNFQHDINREYQLPVLVIVIILIFVVFAMLLLLVCAYRTTRKTQNGACPCCPCF